MLAAATTKRTGHLCKRSTVSEPSNTSALLHDFWVWRWHATLEQFTAQGSNVRLRQNLLEHVLRMFHVQRELILESELFCLHEELAVAIRCRNFEFLPILEVTVLANRVERAVVEELETLDWRRSLRASK